jgi:hypothetical protein
MKRILFTVALLVAGTAAFAQFSGGLKAGVNFNTSKWEAGDGAIDESYGGTAFHIGVYGNFAFSDALSVQPEILYNVLKHDAEELTGDDITTNYLSVPVMLVYAFSDGKFNVQAGPQIGFLMSTDPSEYKDDDLLAGTDFTLNLGAGANFGKFNVTARYGIGLSNVTGSTITDQIDDFSIKNNNIQISVGYKLFGGE